MSRESLFPFLPPALAAVDRCLDRWHRRCPPTGLPCHGGRVSSRDVRGGSVGGSPRKSVQFVGLVTLLAGVAITACQWACSIFRRSLRLCG